MIWSTKIYFIMLMYVLCLSVDTFPPLSLSSQVCVEFGEEINFAMTCSFYFSTLARIELSEMKTKTTKYNHHDSELRLLISYSSPHNTTTHIEERNRMSLKFNMSNMMSQPFFAICLFVIVFISFSCVFLKS